MPYLIADVIVDRFVLTDVWGTVTEDEFLRYDAEAVARMAHLTDGPLIHTLYRIHEPVTLPKASFFTRMKVSHHPLIGWTLVCGVSSPMVRFLITIAAGIAGNRLRFFATVGEAVEFLVWSDASMEALRAFDLRQYGRTAER